MWSSLRICLLIVSVAITTQSYGNTMVHQEGSLLVDGTGNPLKLRGFLLEGWLMWNGTLWGAGLTSETQLLNKLTALVGAEETERFQQQIYSRFVTERDINMIAALGFNVVRVPINHRLLEDDSQPYVYKNSGWQIIDKLLAWCEKNNVYVVLDLHSAPGGQSTMFVNDPDGSGFYHSEENIKRTVALWKAIASRYHDRQIIAGYDLLNEPQLPWFTPGQRLVDIYERIIAAIRTVDSDHMVILSGAGAASNDLSMFTEVIDANQMLAFHTYNLFSSNIGKTQHQSFATLAESLQVPLWNGEIGAHTSEWVSAVIEMFEDPAYQVSGWVFWPWKRVPEHGTRFRHFMGIESTPSWTAVRYWLAGAWFTPKPTQEASLKGMREFLQAIDADRLKIDEEMRAIVTRYNNR